jgi:hypothetical protein
VKPGLSFGQSSSTCPGAPVKGAQSAQTAQQKRPCAPRVKARAPFSRRRRSPRCGDREPQPPPHRCCSPAPRNRARGGSAVRRGPDIRTVSRSYGVLMPGRGPARAAGGPRPPSPPPPFRTAALTPRRQAAGACQHCPAISHSPQTPRQRRPEYPNCRLVPPHPRFMQTAQK